MSIFEAPSMGIPLVYKATADESAGEITGKPMNLDLTTITPEETFDVFPDA